jgi:hypothetical protein
MSAVVVSGRTGWLETTEKMEVWKAHATALLTVRV